MRRLNGSTLVTSIRDEGPFVLEWIAWYRMLGFENILVMHNDCTDHSPQLLRLLERAGILVQKKNVPDPARPPQPQNHVVATGHRLVREASWVFVADVDEYLVVHTGDRSAAALAEAVEGKGIGMAINWRIFGSAGKAAWRDAFLHRRFTRAGPVTARQNSCFKTFFKEPAAFGKLRAHGPCNWQGAAWGEDDRVFLLADGKPYVPYHPTRGPQNGTTHARMSNTLAQVNHYAVQSHEQYAHKRGRFSAAMLADRYTDDFFQRFDRNETVNTDALAYQHVFDQAYAELAAIPGVMRLHHLCCADYVSAMCAKRGDDPKADPRYRMHMETAQALPRH
jgi:Glycosyl transferase family 2